MGKISTKSVINMDYYRALVFDKDKATVKYMEDSGWFCGDHVVELQPIAAYNRKDGELKRFTMMDESGMILEEAPPEVFQVCYKQVE